MSVISKEYKQYLTTNPQVRLMKTNLWDLLFYKDVIILTDDDNREVETWSYRLSNLLPSDQSYRQTGLTLGHTTLAYNDKMYLSNTIVETSPTPTFTPDLVFQRWQDFGLDICMPKYDSNAKKIKINKNNIFDIISNDPLFKDSIFTTVERTDIEDTFQEILDLFLPNHYEDYGNFIFYPEEAALSPDDVRTAMCSSAFMHTSPTGFSSMSDFDLSGTKIYFRMDGSTVVPSAIKETDIDSIKSGATSPLILAGRDTTFKDRFLTETAETDNDAELLSEPMNGILLNILHQGSLLPFFKTIFTPEIIKEQYSISADALKSENFLGRLNLLNSENETYVSFKQAAVAYILFKNVHVYVKASVFADYIDYQDFNQKLDQTADVKHRNLLISGNENADINAFNTEYLYSEASSGFVEEQRPVTSPHLPKVSASIDLTNIVTDESSFYEGVEKGFLEKTIGTLPTKPFIDPNTFLEVSHPYLVLSEKDIETKYQGQSVPNIIPPSGNLFVDGRILSPEIDAIWKAIKLISGLTDSNISPEQDFGAISTANENTCDLIERFVLKNYTVGQDRDQLGDPTNINYDLENNVYSIDKWVSTTKEFTVEKLKSHINFMTDLAAMSSSSEVVLENPEAIKDYISTAYSQGILSNRELEGMIRGIQYNIALLYKTLKKSSVIVGSLANGKGGLHQLHKDYEGNLATTNTLEYVDNTSLGLVDGVDLSLDTPTTESWGTYLGADGLWHSTSQKCIIPVKKELW